MKAIFNFIPKFCPNCGDKLFTPESASELGSLKATIDDYHAGEPFTCDCGLAFEKRTASDPDELRRWCHERINFLQDAVAQYRHELFVALGCKSEADLDDYLNSTRK